MGQFKTLMRWSLIKTLSFWLQLICIILMLSVAGCGAIGTTETRDRASPFGGLSNDSFENNADPSDSPKLLAHAKIAKSQGKSDEALFYFVRLLEVEPNQSDALIGIGEIHREKGNLDLAEMAYRLALKTYPKSIDAKEGLGLTLATKQSDKEAEQLLLAVVNADTSRWRAHNALGLLANRSEQPLKAIEHFDQSLKHNPHDPLTLTNLGYSKYLVRDESGAMAEYDKALQLDPEFELAWQKKGMLFAKQGQDRAALEAYRHVMNEADAYNELGNNYMMQGDVDSAHSMFEKAIAVSPSYHEKANHNLQKLKALADHWS